MLYNLRSSSRRSSRLFADAWANQCSEGLALGGLVYQVHRLYLSLPLVSLANTTSSSLAYPFSLSSLILVPQTHGLGPGPLRAYKGGIGQESFGN